MSLVISSGNAAKALDLFKDKPKIKKACIKAGCSEAHADAFIKELEAQNGAVCSALTTINSAIIKKMVGKDVLMKHLHSSPILKRVFTASVLVPQFTVLGASFDMSVHSKGDALQLWMSYTKGGKQILADVKDPG